MRILSILLIGMLFVGCAGIETFRTVEDDRKILGVTGKVDVTTVENVSKGFGEWLLDVVTFWQDDKGED